MKHSRLSPFVLSLALFACSPQKSEAVHYSIKKNTASGASDEGSANASTDADAANASNSNGGSKTQNTGVASADDRPSGTKPQGFGPNVLIFDPATPQADMQAKLDQVFKGQESNQFGTERYALLFKPGSYNLDVKVGFYTQVLGLGASPDNTTITGAVRVTADWFKGNGTQNFWRGAENLAIVPTIDNNTNIWAVSQATQLRRIHMKGATILWDAKYDPAWTSGGYIADTVIDDKIVSGSQQQFLTRNSNLHEWYGSVWNMVFVGDRDAPADDWKSHFTTVGQTPSVREKPYLTIDSYGNYAVAVPAMKSNSSGASWAGGAKDPVVSIDQFYIAHAGYDTAGSINDALDAGKSIILTPGVYHTKNSLHITKPNTIILGLGIATVIPDLGTEAFVIDDVDGVTLTGVLFEAGAKESPTLVRVGDAKNAKSHAASPVVLSDLSCRVGGATAGLAKSCVTINSNNVLIDNVWLWRADHGNGVGWNVNKAMNGIIVNGDNVTAYGLFVEHFEQYQTLWNGENGQVFFYQSEIPYDVPSQGVWKHDNVNGYSSFKVADKVQNFNGQGMGIYCFFDNPALLENAIEASSAPGVKIRHVVTQWLGTAKGSGISHILNGTGKSVLWVASGIDSAYSDN